MVVARGHGVRLVNFSALSLHCNCRLGSWFSTLYVYVTRVCVCVYSCEHGRDRFTKLNVVIGIGTFT